MCERSEPEPSGQLTLFAGVSPARTSRWLEDVLAWLEDAPGYSGNWPALLAIFARDGSLSKTCPVFCRPVEEWTWEPCSGSWGTSGIGGPTVCLTLNTSVWPSDAVACSLSRILEREPVPQRYFLSPRACAGILRRAAKRGRELPAALREALGAVVRRNNNTHSSEDGESR